MREEPVLTTALLLKLDLCQNILCELYHRQTGQRLQNGRSINVNQHCINHSTVLIIQIRSNALKQWVFQIYTYLSTCQLTVFRSNWEFFTNTGLEAGWICTIAPDFRSSTTLPVYTFPNSRSGTRYKHDSIIMCTWNHMGTEIAGMITYWGNREDENGDHKQ